MFVHQLVLGTVTIFVPLLVYRLVLGLVIILAHQLEHVIVHILEPELQTLPEVE